LEILDIKSEYRNPKQFRNSKLDDIAKTGLYPVFVIPAKAGIQLNHAILDSRLRGSDGLSDFLHDYQKVFV
jgi:hypothetical protein